jgi:hypothetical protein
MSDDRPTPRRDFIGQLATGAVMLTGAAACAPAVASQGVASGAGPAAAPAPANRSQWDDTWFAKLTAAHKAAFDSPEIVEGMAIRHVTGYLQAMKDIHGADAQAVLVIRHSAVPMVFNDTIWGKYEVGKQSQTTSGREGQFATRNPYAAQITQLNTRGVIILACDLATRNYSGRLAQPAGEDRNAVYAAIKANLLPGVILQPTGVYGFHRAQEAGCTGIRST